MAGIIYDLKDILVQQKECYEGLYTLANYKTEAIKTKELDLITQVVEREEEFIGRLGILEKKRKSILKDISLVTSIKYEELTITRLIDKMGSELEISEELAKIKKDMTHQIRLLEEQNKLNKILIEQSLEFVDFSINALQNLQTGMSHLSYARQGEEVAGQVQSYFDKRQ